MSGCSCHPYPPSSALLDTFELSDSAKSSQVHGQPPGQKHGLPDLRRGPVRHRKETHCEIVFSDVFGAKAVAPHCWKPSIPAHLASKQKRKASLCTPRRTRAPHSPAAVGSTPLGTRLLARRAMPKVTAAAAPCTAAVNVACWGRESNCVGGCW